MPHFGYLFIDGCYSSLICVESIDEGFLGLVLAKVKHEFMVHCLILIFNSKEASCRENVDMICSLH